MIPEDKEKEQGRPFALLYEGKALMGKRYGKSRFPSLDDLLALAML
jgi:hypothetical protein